MAISKTDDPPIPFAEFPILLNPVESPVPNMAIFFQTHDKVQNNRSSHLIDRVHYLQLEIHNIAQDIF